MERHRALCDHFRQRIGPMKRPTYSELDRENREYRQSISDHKKVCTYNRLQSPASDSDNDDPMNDVTTYMDQPTSTTLQELIAGPSNSASIFPASPVRKSLSTDFARAAYPSPESLPRPRAPRPFSSSSSPPASPTPQSRTSGSQNGDLDIEMDEPGLGQPEDLRNMIATLQEQNDALEKETKQISTERTTLNEKLEAASKRVKALELELECINAELDERDGAVSNLQEQISFLENACSADAIFHADELEVLSGLLQESKDEVAGLKEAFVRAARTRVEQEKREFLALGLTHPFE
ncbi:hypothetical protein BD779DRAFT_907091 [Infundibulicybe gibba]|nr:hypothetical protein BD779DRAFT_907091 [Infundibulicybe gibba]